MVAITGDGATVDAIDVSALHQAHWPGLWRLAVLLTSDGEVAEDLVQEAFARLLRVSGRRRGPDPGTEVAYLRRTVVNLSNSRFRHLGVARRHAPSLVADGDHPSAEAEAGTSADGRRVRAAVAALPARQRACTVLHYFEGLTDAEVAAVLGISNGSVKTHLHRARAALAAALGEHEEER